MADFCGLQQSVAALSHEMLRQFGSPGSIGLVSSISVGGLVPGSRGWRGGRNP